MWEEEVLAYEPEEECEDKENAADFAGKLARGKEEELASSPSLIAAYLRDVRKVPLLTADEEKELALRIEQGDEAARARMIASNLRLVVKIAKAYVNRGLPYMDLIAEGNIGLMHGVEKFRADKGCRFSTYGSWWIRQAIERAIFKQSRTIRVPVHVLEDNERLKRCAKALRQELGREPKAAEMAEKSGFSAQYIELLQEATQTICSIESVVDEDGELALKQMLAETEAETPLDAIWETEKDSCLREALGGLGERHRRVLEMRYGMDGGEPRTLRAIGDVLGITRERVRQIENEALLRVRGILLGEKKEEKKEAA